ncbi:MAG: agmatine deiminase family protein [Candidatus Delongbacteria bacterium]|nr:agmatine deiminase family protein [Candidatus Delongbacteria bacterium]MBN2834855.1 agmatine deiminase family protein [Candidatus Delongbacteria bacterium]
MRKLIFFVLLIAISLSYAKAGTTVKKEFTDAEIQKMTEKWYEKHPNSKPHWLEVGEKEKMQEYLRAFYVTDPPEGTPRATAEFEPMEGVLIRYPFGIPMSLIKELAEDTKLVTIVSSQSQQNTVMSQYTSNSVNTANCEFLIAPTESYWTRDYGPWYAAIDDSDVSIVNFPYNRPRPNDNDIPIRMSEFLNVDLYGMAVVQTGGNYMTDGMGIAASTTIVYTESQQELGISPTEVDQRMLDYLGMSTYHVIEDPNNTYIDHIDCWGKFLDVDKVLLREVPTTHPQYDEIEEVVEYFENQTSSYGTPYEIYRVWTPNNEPFTNSLILNNKVCVPIMGGSNDAAALAVYEAAMPGYEVIGFIGGSEPWESTDALHCRTRGIADREMLYIRHIALLGDQPLGNDYTITAKIVSYGNHQINNDEVKLNYRVNGGDYQSIVMTPEEDGINYTATIPEQTEGSEIAYYITAADDSGRLSNHPYIGAPDPHIFHAGQAFYPNIVVNNDPINVELGLNGTTSQTLQINNSGQLELNYQLSSEVFAFENLEIAVTNSPAGNAYNSNTYTENNWTDVEVTETGLCGQVTLSYNWSTDNYPAEGSLHIESPYGTEVIMGSGMTSGNYENITEMFNGENITGNWKIWIEDTYGDGGHQATNVQLIISKTLDIPEWLSLSQSSGTVQPGSSGDVQINFNSTGLVAGIYEGLITLNCNDPDQAEIEIPVNLTVNGTGITEQVPGKVELVGNYPNPFNPETSIVFSLDKTSNVNFTVYNAAGELVKSSNELKFNSGKNSIKFDASGLNSGVYFYRLSTGRNIVNGKMLLVK